MLLGSVEDGVPLSPGERARETRSLAIIALFDGWSTGVGMARMSDQIPRRLTLSEAAAWREGFAEGRALRRDQERRDAEFAAWAAEYRAKQERRKR